MKDARERGPSRVLVLDDALVDQIAAGEVVERPASVVKELLENALDAGALNVAVSVDGGGVGRIRVSDDGHGMSPEDALLSVRRHATSKIREARDLEAIATLGFRGEALPSIASVSRFSLTTRTADTIAATRVEVLGGSAPTHREAGAAPGTTVEVADLFFNLPARRKFLKSQATESAHVSDTCLRVALSTPSLRLTLERDGRRVREYLPTDARRSRAAAAFKDTLRPLSGERDGVRVEAYLSAPERARNGATGLYVFINDRAVKDRGLTRAVAFAYGSVLPPGRYPTGVVYVDIDPREIDVNVHPQKAEVRFAKGRAVLDAITRVLAGALGVSPFAGPSDRGKGYWSSRLAGRASPSATSTSGEGAPELDGADTWGLAGAFRDSLAPYPAPTPSGAPDEPAQAGLLPTAGYFGSMRVLGQVRRMLIICESSDALQVLDQHAVDERIKYDRLRKAHRAGTVATQRLLFPERIEVSAAEAAFVEEHREEIASMGLDAAPVGATTVAVHAVPQLVKRAAPERLLRDILGELGRSGDRAFGDAIDMSLATMACHGAIRAGDPLSLEECAALLAALDEVDDFAGHCPHGRPVVHGLPFSELTRRLGR